MEVSEKNNEEPLLGAPQKSPRRRLLSLVVLAAVLFLLATSTMAQWASLSEFFLYKQCVTLGMRSCNPPKFNTSTSASGHPSSNSLFEPSYSPLCFNRTAQEDNHDEQELQENTAAFFAMWMLLSNIASLIACPLVGAIGDSFGRKAAMLLPTMGFLLQNIAMALLPPKTPVVIYTVLTACLPALGGGLFAFVQVAFASVADIFEDATTKERARAFAMVESSLWLGLTIGPFLIGTLIKPLGFPNVLWVVVGGYVVTVLLLLVLYRETNVRAKQRSCRGRCAHVNWKVANPFGSIVLVATSDSLNRKGRVKLIILCISGFFALLCASGPFTIIPFYAILLFDMPAVQIGVFQGVYFGSCAVCLFFVLPLVTRCFRLERILQFSIAWTSFSWALPSLVRTRWQLFVVASLFFFNSLYFPILRASTASLFPPTQYGTALAIVGSMQQLTQVVGPPLSDFLWGQVDAAFTTRSAEASCRPDGTLGLKWDAPFGLNFLGASALGCLGLCFALCVGTLDDNAPHKQPDAVDKTSVPEVNVGADELREPVV